MRILPDKDELYDPQKTRIFLLEVYPQSVGKPPRFGGAFFQRGNVKMAEEKGFLELLSKGIKEILEQKERHMVQPVHYHKERINGVRRTVRYGLRFSHKGDKGDFIWSCPLCHHREIISYHPVHWYPDRTIMEE